MPTYTLALALTHPPAHRHAHPTNRPPSRARLSSTMSQNFWVAQNHHYDVVVVVVTPTLIRVHITGCRYELLGLADHRASPGRRRQRPVGRVAG